MTSSCPRCGSEIHPGEVSVRPPSGEDGSSSERREVVKCLCCGTLLSRPVGGETWQY